MVAADLFLLSFFGHASLLTYIPYLTSCFNQYPYSSSQQSLCLSSRHSHLFSFSLLLYASDLISSSPPPLFISQALIYLWVIEASIFFWTPLIEYWKLTYACLQHNCLKIVWTNVVRTIAVRTLYKGNMGLSFAYLGRERALKRLHWPLINETG